MYYCMCYMGAFSSGICAIIVEQNPQTLKNVPACIHERDFVLQGEVLLPKLQVEGLAQNCKIFADVAVRLRRFRRGDLGERRLEFVALCDLVIERRIRNPIIELRQSLFRTFLRSVGEADCEQAIRLGVALLDPSRFGSDGCQGLLHECGGERESRKTSHDRSAHCSS